MQAGFFLNRRSAWVAIGVLAASSAALWSWKRTALPPVVESRDTAPSFVQLAGAGGDPVDLVLRERAELFDPTPLFFPTEWNYGQGPLRLAAQREPAQVFADIEPKFVFQEQTLRLSLAGAVQSGFGLTEVLAQGDQAPVGGIGHVDGARSPMPARKAFVEVFSLAKSVKILAQSIARIELPRPDFTPLEFLVLVGPSGVVGDPVLEAGSGGDEVDAFFREYLVRTFRLGERLTPGRYRVVIGP